MTRAIKKRMLINATFIIFGLLLGIAILPYIPHRPSVQDRFGNRKFIDHWVYPRPFRELRDGTIYYFS